MKQEQLNQQDQFEQRDRHDQKTQKDQKVQRTQKDQKVQFHCEQRSSKSVVSLRRLGAVIRNYREERGLSLEAFCQLAELSVTDMKALEQGRWDIDLLSLQTVAGCLGISMKTIIATVEDHEDRISE